MLNMSRTLAAAMLLAFAAGLGSTVIVSSANAGVIIENKPRPDKASQAGGMIEEKKMMTKTKSFDGNMKKSKSGVIDPNVNKKLVPAVKN
jgi:hypothetical protein